MVITQIEWISKTKAKIYLNDAFAFVLLLSELRELELAEGDEVDDALYAHIMQDYLLKRAKLKAMQLLNARDYTEYELRTKLKRDLFPDGLIQQAIAYVASYHYIDDERYTRYYLEYHSSGQSRQVLRQKLLGKGIASELIERCLEDAELDEKETIRQLLTKKYGTRFIDDSAVKKKAIGYLLRRGYTYHDVRDVMQDMRYE